MSDARVTLVVTLATALIYLCGYGYLFGFYQYFDIGVWEVGLSVHDILSHALPAVGATVTNNFVLFGCFLLFVSIVTLITFGMDFKKVPLIFVLASFFLIFVTLFSSKNIGESRAREEVRLLNRFEFSNEVYGRLSEVVGTSDLHWHHLVSSKDTFFVVGLFNSGEDRWVARIPRSGTNLSVVYQDP